MDAVPPRVVPRRPLWRGRRWALGVGLLVGICAGLPPLLTLDSWLSGQVGMDSDRLQLIRAGLLATLLALLWAIASRQRLAGLIAGAGAVLSGVMVPSTWMALAQRAPGPLQQTLDWAHLALNPLILGIAALTPAALGLAGSALWSRHRRPGIAQVLLTAVIISTVPATLATASPLAFYGPAYGVHHVILPTLPALPAMGLVEAAGGSRRACQGVSTLEKLQLISPALHGPRTVGVQLPAGYPRCAPAGGYPVLFLLHGDPGSYLDWVRVGGGELVDAAAAGGAGPFLVVYPDGAGPRWTDWTDSPDHHWLMGRFISEDLVRYVDTHYLTAPRRDQRFIAGISSGGYGAASLALGHPSVFGGFASYSGYYDTGHVGGTHLVAATSAPLTLAGSMPPNTVHAVLAVGTTDGHYTDEERRFAELLQRRRWDFIQLEMPGGHSWEQWKAFLWRSLPVLHSWAVGPPAAVGR